MAGGFSGGLAFEFSEHSNGFGVTLGKGFSSTAGAGNAVGAVWTAQV